MTRIEKTVLGDGTWHCRINGQRVSRRIYEQAEAVANAERSSVLYLLGGWISRIGARLQAPAEREISKFVATHVSGRKDEGTYHVRYSWESEPQQPEV